MKTNVSKCTCTDCACVKAKAVTRCCQPVWGRRNIAASASDIDSLYTSQSESNSTYKRINSNTHWGR